MHTRFVYVLVSTPHDLFYEQTLVSISSLKRYNPTAKVVLVVDDKTDETLIEKRSSMKSLIEEKIVIPFPEGVANKQRSRRLKTNLRNIVMGDFLYLDSDTVVCDNLDEVDSFDFQIGMVWDSNHIFNKDKDRLVVDRAKLLGYDVSGELEYFNSGVMFVKDCEKTHEFFTEWHNEYLKAEIKGCVFDQPPLMITNMRHHAINAIDGIYNCQLFGGGFSYFNESKILHIYNVFGFVDFFRLSSSKFLLKIKEQNKLYPEDIVLLENPKKQFEGDYMIAFGKNLDFYHSACYHVFAFYPKKFQLLEVFSKLIMKLC